MEKSDSFKDFKAHAPRPLKEGLISFIQKLLQTKGEIEAAIAQGRELQRVYRDEGALSALRSAESKLDTAKELVFDAKAAIAKFE